MVLSIVIPAYNEENTICALLTKVVSVVIEDVEKEPIVVSDCSKDRTIGLVKRFFTESQN